MEIEVIKVTLTYAIIYFVCMCEYAMAGMQRLEDNLWKLLLFIMWGPGIKLSFGNKYLYPLSHPAGPGLVIFKHTVDQPTKEIACLTLL